MTGGNTTVAGGGVYVDGTFTMSGGYISQNSASEGGGVLIMNRGRFTMSGGYISDNSASEGGGVYVNNDGTFTMSSDSISQNSAGDLGGGVYMYGTFEMSGGSIYGNSAEDGGGVFVGRYREFTMSGGSISGNNATSDGNAVYNDAGTVTLSDTVYAGTDINGANATVVSAATAARDIGNYGYLLVTQAPVFSTVQAVLGSQIGMKFYMVIPTYYIGDNGPSVIFTVTDAEGTARSETVVGQQSGFRYEFTCGVNSLEMADTIHAVYTYIGDEGIQTVTKDISVKDYLSVLINDSAYAAAAPLAKAIWNYGYYAQQALDTDKLHIQMSSEYTSDSTLVSKLTDFPVTLNLGSDATKATCSVNLDSETKLNIYLTPSEGTTLTKNDVTVTATADTTFTYDVEERSSRYCVVISGIGAHELGDVFTVTTDGGTTLTASALSYAQLVLDSSMKQNVKNAAAALYAYYVESIKYKNSLTS